MNNDLISRSELKKEFAKFDRLYIADTGNELVNAFAVDKLIRNAPTISIDWGVDDGDRTVYARPQGEWIKNLKTFCLECSECGKSALYNKIGVQIESKFCPYCGAKIKRDEEE